MNRKLAAIAIACAALSCATATSAVAQTAQTMHLPGRVMTWNVNAGGPNSPELYADEIAKYRPEVIGVQESCRTAISDTVAELRKRGLNYHVAYGTVRSDPWNCGLFGGNAFGQAILSASPITYNPATDNVGYHQDGSEPRGYMVVTTKVNGKDTKVFNTHLAQADAAEIRLDQVSQLLPRARRYSRAIILGDFNAQPRTTEIKRVWRHFRDADPACNPDSALTDCKTTLTGSNGVTRKFDYIFLRGLAQPGVGVHDSPGSDHHLVHADLRG